MLLAKTGSGESVVLSAKSASGLTVVEMDEVLLAAVGSSSNPETLT